MIKLLEFYKDDFGRFSSARLHMAGAWIVSSFCLIYNAVTGHWSDTHATAYLAAFVTNYVATKKLTPPKDSDASSPTDPT